MRFRLTALLALLLPLLSLAGDTRAASLVGRGDLGIFAETLSLSGEGGRSRLLLVTQFSVADLHWDAVGDSLEARIQCEWSLDALGETFVAVNEELRLHRPVGSSPQAMLYLRSQELPAGEYRFTMRCRDLGRKLGGVLGLFGRHPESLLSDIVELRDLSAGGCLSDLLLYSVPPANRPVVLNASGVFLAGDTALELAGEFLPPTDGSGAGHLGLRVEILDAKGGLRFQKKGGWRYETAGLPLRFRLPLTDLESGDYRVTMTAHGPAFAETQVSREFSIIAAAGIDEEVLARRSAEAQLFLDGGAYESWLSLPALDRVRMMERFWRRHDTNPRDEANEIYDEFRRRYELAQERYTVIGAGALTDRGRMLILYGEPEEISEEAMPLNRRELSNAIRDLHGEEETEPGMSPWVDEPGAGVSSGVNTGSRLGRDLSSVGTGTSLGFGQDSEAFEVWDYELGGYPLLERYRLHLQGIGLKVIFLDRQGYGEYELVYRSEDFEF
jgi:GWxTD domain-containing protein